MAACMAVLGVMVLDQPARAQTTASPVSDTSAPTSGDPEALARAQRAADRVKAVILMDAKLNAAPASAVRPAAKPPVRQTNAAARPVAGLATTRQAAPASAARVAASGAGAVVQAVARPTLVPGSRQSLSVVEATSTPPPSNAAASLFDFETSKEGFTLHSLVDWVELPAAGMTLTPQAAHGKYALQATSPTDAWLGVDLSDSVAFSALKRITFSMRSARGTAGRLAIKSGSQYDWCELRPSVIGIADGFVNYEVELQAKGRECKNLDLEDVRGLHWFVRAGDTVILDNVELR